MPSRYLGIIPARAGSKRILGKNTRLLGGSPLISYTITAAHDSRLLDTFVVSTEDDKIATLAHSYGAPVLHRPAKLAEDNATSGEVAAHALEAMEADGQEFAAVVLLHPTSPFRTAKHIDGAIEKLESDDWYESLASTELLPKKAHDNVLVPGYDWFSDCEIMNGAIYIIEANRLKKTREHAWADTTYVMPHQDSIDIDDELDWRIAEMILASKTRH